MQATFPEAENFTFNGSLIEEHEDGAIYRDVQGHYYETKQTKKGLKVTFYKDLEKMAMFVGSKVFDRVFEQARS